MSTLDIGWLFGARTKRQAKEELEIGEERAKLYGKDRVKRDVHGNQDAVKTTKEEEEVEDR